MFRLLFMLGGSIQKAKKQKRRQKQYEETKQNQHRQRKELSTRSSGSIEDYENHRNNNNDDDKIDIGIGIRNDKKASHYTNESSISTISKSTRLKRPFFQLNSTVKERTGIGGRGEIMEGHEQWRRPRKPITTMTNTTTSTGDVQNDRFSYRWGFDLLHLLSFLLQSNNKTTTQRFIYAIPIVSKQFHPCLLLGWSLWN